MWLPKATFNIDTISTFRHTLTIKPDHEVHGNVTIKGLYLNMKVSNGFLPNDFDKFEVKDFYMFVTNDV